MSAYLSLIGRRRGGHLFETGRLFKVGTNSRLGTYSNNYDKTFQNLQSGGLARNFK